MNTKPKTGPTVDKENQPQKHNPNALQPPFDYKTILPVQWAYLDVDEATWEEHTNNIIDEYYLPFGLQPEHHGTVFEQLKQAVSFSRSNKVLTTLVFPVLYGDGYISTAQIFIRWKNVAPDNASLISLDKTFQDHDACQKTTMRGTRYLLTTRKTPIPNDLLTLTEYYALIPVERTSWYLTVAGNTVSESFEETIRETVIFIADNAVFSAS